MSGVHVKEENIYEDRPPSKSACARGISAIMYVADLAGRHKDAGKDIFDDLGTQTKGTQIGSDKASNNGNENGSSDEDAPANGSDGNGAEEKGKFDITLYFAFEKGQHLKAELKIVHAMKGEARIISWSQ